MAVTIIVPIPAKDAETSATTQYTATAPIMLDLFSATNTTGSNITLTVNLVPSGGTAASSNAVVSGKVVAPGEKFRLVGHNMVLGESISTTASATGLTIRASARLVT